MWASGAARTRRKACRERTCVQVVARGHQQLLQLLRLRRHGEHVARAAVALRGGAQLADERSRGRAQQLHLLLQHPAQLRQLWQHGHLRRPAGAVGDARKGTITQGRAQRSLQGAQVQEAAPRAHRRHQQHGHVLLDVLPRARRLGLRRLQRLLRVEQRLPVVLQQRLRRLQLQVCGLDGGRRALHALQQRLQ